MEADKLQDLQGESASWSPRRANAAVLVWEPGELVVYSEDQQAGDPERVDVSDQVQRQQTADVLVWRQSGRKNSFIPGVGAGGSGKPFCSTQAFKWLDDDHLHWGEQSILLS